MSSVSGGLGGVVPPGTDRAIRLLIADDHPVVRDGLRGIFEASGEFEVAGEAANGREAVDRAAALRPDVVLMDLRMPVLDGVSAIKMLAEKGIGARVLVLTTYDTDTDVVPAIEAGATGYLLKDAPPDELPSSASTTGPPPWRPGSGAACCPAPDLGRRRPPSPGRSGERGEHPGPFGFNDLSWCTGRAGSHYPPGREPGSAAAAWRALSPGIQLRSGLGQGLPSAGR
jgi:CheY-like chemotaxis protein